MTNEEAVKILQAIKPVPHRGDCKSTTHLLETMALEMAIAALEKEIPKPISIESGFVKCGGCGMYIRLPIMDHYNNCPECGQKILWEGDSE